MPEANEGLHGDGNIEECFAKCNKCAADLSYIEHTMLGNRCVFCADKIYNPPLWGWIRNAWYDWRIYQVLLKWKGDEEHCEECGGEGKFRASKQEDIRDMTECPTCRGTGFKSVGRTKLIGYMGAVGADSLAAMTLKQKRELLKEMKR